MRTRLIMRPALVLMFCFLAVTGKDKKQIVDSDNLVLFSFDDHWLPFQENLQLTLERPTKYAGNPVMRGGSPNAPDGFGSLLYGTVLHENGKFRMWYIASPRIDRSIPGDAQRMRSYRPIAYAESQDGIHWEKPNLNLVDFRGNKNNNLIQIEPSADPLSRPYDFVAVLRDEHDPDPARRYKMAYIVTHPVWNCSSTVTAVSADGLRWKLVNSVPITEGSYENSGLIFFNNKYYVSGQTILYPPKGTFPEGTPSGRIMTVFESPDFLHWSSGHSLGFWRPEYMPEAVHDGQETHLGAGLWNRGNVILGLYGRWHGDPTPGPRPIRLKGVNIDLGFIVSNDALHYREPVPRFVMVPLGKETDWDSVALLQANAFYNSDKETYIWYTSWDTGGGAVPAVQDPLGPHNRPFAIGLLTMPRDRFGYLARLPGKIQYNQTTVVSREIRLRHSAKLFVNVDGVSPSDALKIELVDQFEQPLSGFTAQVTTNALKGQVQWAGGKDLPSDRSFRIKVSWARSGPSNPRLYALYVER